MLTDKIYEINGGFPPLKYCKKTKDTKERSFAPIVNIKSILYKKTNDKIINLNENNDFIETIDEL